MEALLGKTLTELQEIALSVGLQKFAGKQLAGWLYVRRVTSFDEMTNISLKGREALKANYTVGRHAPVREAVSKDGTRKYLFAIGEQYIESVYIPEEDRATLCVSTQMGCKMGCRFCMTGRQGFHGNLDAADILSQFFAIEEAADLTNAVFMGMGEPLDNWDQVKRVIDVLTAPWGLAWSPKRITLSTVGVLPKVRQYLEECRCHLAVSLHNPFPEERLELMPVEKAWPSHELIDLLKQYDFTGQRRVSFEYTLFAGWNDSKRHADALVRLLRGLECRVNLIRFHRIPDFPYTTPSQLQMEAFRDRLSAGGVTATIRASRGEDILAACGLLAGKHNER